MIPLAPSRPQRRHRRRQPLRSEHQAKQPTQQRPLLSGREPPRERGLNSPLLYAPTNILSVLKLKLVSKGLGGSPFQKVRAKPKIAAQRPPTKARREPSPPSAVRIKATPDLRGGFEARVREGSICRFFPPRRVGESSVIRTSTFARSQRSMHRLCVEP